MLIALAHAATSKNRSVSVDFPTFSIVETRSTPNQPSIPEPRTLLSTLAELQHAPSCHHVSISSLECERESEPYFTFGVHCKSVKSVPREIVLKRTLARGAACTFVPGQFDDEEFKSVIISCIEAELRDLEQWMEKSRSGETGAEGLSRQPGR